MTMKDPRFKAFDRRMPEGLEADDTPLSEVLHSMATTASIFEAFGWELRPLGRWRRFIWDAPAQGDGVSRATGDTSDSCAACVGINVRGDDSHEDADMVFSNDLEFFLQLAELQRTRGIGRLDGSLLVEAVKSLVLSAAGHAPAAMPIELFAMLVEGREHKAGEQAAQSGALQ